jgi:VIT1/CCC1 family predicted Fe2+/Mn2+ transporter
MSESVSYHWSLEAQRRRQAYLDRIQENTANFSSRYRAKFDDLVNQGLEDYMPNEFAELRNQLSQLDRLVSADPERARDLSYQVGQQLSQLPGLARAARSEFEARERQRRKELSEMRRQATTALSQYIHNLISEIKDPVELDFAYDEIRTIQTEYQGKTVEASELSVLKSLIGSRFSEIKNSAKIKAETWKNKQVKSIATETSEELLSFYAEQACLDAAKNPKALDAMLSSLNTVKQLIDKKANPEEIRNKIEAAATQADSAIADENCRRMVVRSIMDSLEKSGFVVSKPKRSSGEVDEVVILARKPAGAEAAFRVTADGSMIYKFDHYEGMQCKDDIEKVLPLLRDIYGVDLSDERVFWQNPERISKSAKPIEGDIGGQKNG